jgi:EAL domain-containing protein (putative c-di-GMP-specific phosphodiesterase class I)
MPQDRPSKPFAQGRAVPYLECYPEQGGPAQRVPLLKLPFMLGRSETADHTIYSSKVSNEHAAIVASGEGLAVRDLDSTNGTFVNGRRTAEQLLQDGDIIHVAHVEFCFRHRSALETAAAGRRDPLMLRTQVTHADQPDSIIRGTELLRELIDTAAVEILYQPIVDLQTKQIFGYEALGRGTHPELSRSPEALLRLAEQCGMVIELSDLLRRTAVTSCQRLEAGTRLFVNTHASELGDPRFLASLATLRGSVRGDHAVVVEIAESSVTDPAAMVKNKEGFARLGLEFAYDDFGAGQARLLELTDIPPHYLKFDKAMIQGIEQAMPRQEVVGALLSVVRRFGVRVIAEGIESEEVAGVCRRLGCDLGQGFLFGRPS